MTTLATAGLLVFACNRVVWLLPILLQGLGGLAELQFLAVIGWTKGGAFCAGAPALRAWPLPRRNSG